jgi:hypothetical protein
MSDDLWFRALALPPAQRAELAHALMDSLYEEVDWDTGPGWHIEPDPEISGVPPAVGPRGSADVVQLAQHRSSPKRA